MAQDETSKLSRLVSLYFSEQLVFAATNSANEIIIVTSAPTLPDTTKACMDVLSKDPDTAKYQVKVVFKHNAAT